MKTVLITAIPIILLSCNVATLQSLLNDSQLTESEAIEGIKTALRVGTDKAVDITSKPGGFLRDEAIKILLPEEANKAIAALREAPAGNQIYEASLKPIVDDLIEAVNHSAEDAVTEAAPIFKNAIRQMTVQEAWAILKGEYKNSGDRSATIYFRDKTYNDLVRLFQPKINTSLDKPVVRNTSTNTIWNNFVTTYDRIAKSPANLVLGLEPVQEPNLARYVTVKALDGLFVKVAAEEQKIREDPYNYTEQILRKVFGSPSAS